MALLARDRDWPMRICHLGLRSASHLRTRILRGLLQPHGCKQRHRDQEQKEFSLTIHPLSASSRRAGCCAFNREAQRRSRLQNTKRPRYVITGGDTDPPGIRSVSIGSFSGLQRSCISDSVVTGECMRGHSACNWLRQGGATCLLRVDSGLSFV